MKVKALRFKKVKVTTRKASVSRDSRGSWRVSVGKPA